MKGLTRFLLFLELAGITRRIKKLEQRPTAGGAGGSSQKFIGVNTSKITVSDTEPLKPTEGDLWVDTSNL